MPPQPINRARPVATSRRGDRATAGSPSPLIQVRGGTARPVSSTARRSRARRSDRLPPPALALRHAPFDAARLSPPLTRRNSACSNRAKPRGSPERPDALLIEAARPPGRGQVPGSSALISRWPRTRPVPASTAASACDPLCVSAPITIICTVPSLVDTGEADLRRTAVTGGDATLLLGHAEGPRAAAATEALPVRPGRRRSTRESARRQPENQPKRSDVTAQTTATLTVTAPFA